MDQKQKMIVLGIALVIVFLFARSFKVAPDALGRGGPRWEERVTTGRKKIDDFKNSFDGKDVRTFNRELNRMINQFERNNNVHVIKSTVHSAGPIKVI